MKIRYKCNVFDICILIFTAVLCFLYARKQLEIQELIMMEQMGKIELLSKINISEYNLDEIQAVVDAFRTPLTPMEESEKVKLPWGNVYILVPQDSDITELRKLTKRFPGIKVVLINSDDDNIIRDMFLVRSRTKF